MFISFLILVIVAILSISVSELAKTYEFLTVVVSYTNIALYGALVLFLIFAVISIIKAIKK